MISPLDFKKRYVDLIESGPLNLAIPGTVDTWTAFCLYDAETLAAYAVSERDVALLSSVGLPKSAPGFLNFHLYGIDEIDRMRIEMQLPRAFYPIGFDGGGNPIVIESETGAVLRFWHDEPAPPGFINSSIPQLAESLCLMQEHLEMLTADDFLSALRRVDEAAAIESAFWHQDALDIASLNNA